MLRMAAVRTRKYVRGLRRARRPLDSVTQRWWDEKYAQGVSDSQTIGPGRSERWIRTHYESVERLLERDLERRGVDLAGKHVLDVGSGAGHWVEWALGRGAAHVTASDIALPSAEHLRARWSDDDRVTVRHAVAPDIDGPFDAVVAVGVMFHIVDDAQWQRTIAHLGSALRPGGWLAMTGMFGRIGYADVQVNDGMVTKRLRPYARWRRELAAAGFEDLQLYRNRSWTQVPVPMPEAHVLTAVSRSKVSS
jgi:SAM-dependent methyltransferase